MGGLFHILSLFLNSFNKFNNKTGALVLDPHFISLNVELDIWACFGTIHPICAESRHC